MHTVIVAISGVEAEVRFLADLAEGNLIAEPVVTRDWLRIAELTAHYHNLRLGTVDASVVAAAERLVHEIATLDRRHFTEIASLVGLAHQRGASTVIRAVATNTVWCGRRRNADEPRICDVRSPESRHFRHHARPS
jgi:hypothetical protein